jgi:hypothetical protein
LKSAEALPRRKAVKARGLSFIVGGRGLDSCLSGRRQILVARSNTNLNYELETRRNGSALGFFDLVVDNLCVGLKMVPYDDKYFFRQSKLNKRRRSERI